jgi:hypothetical protein
VANYFLLEAGSGHFAIEDGSGSLLLEQQPVVTGDYLVQEADGTSRFTLEDGTGFILLEAAGPPPPIPVQTGGSAITVRRRVLGRVIRNDQLEQDEAIALSLLLRTRKRPGRPR